MHVKQLFHQAKKDSASYKPVDETTVKLTDDETKKILQQALFAKIAKINSENYLKAVSADPVYKIPSYHDLYEALTKELVEVHKWTIDEFNHDQIDFLCKYFSNDEAFEIDGFSLDKGLLLFGPTGCGKTTLMNILSKNPFNPYTVISCRKIADEYSQHGHVAVQHYSTLRQVTKREWFGHEYVGYCFDDLGTEPNKKNYGNEVNVLADVILNLYDARDGIGRTHLTSNISADDILQNYGERVASRMREMFNVIEFSQNAPDRRK